MCFSGYLKTDFYCIFICVHSLNSAGFNLLPFKANDKFSSSSGKSGLVIFMCAVGSCLRLSCAPAIPYTHMQCGTGTPVQLSDLMCVAWLAHTFNLMTGSAWLILSWSTGKVLEPPGKCLAGGSGRHAGEWCPRGGLPTIAACLQMSACPAPAIVHRVLCCVIDVCHVARAAW